MGVENYLKLPARLRRFAELIVEGETAAEAVRKVRPQCNRPKQQGYTWRHNPRVAAAIEELEAATVIEAGITRLSVLRRLNKVADRCMQAEEVRDRKGEPTGEYQFDSAGANRALELLGKYHKLFTDKAEVTGAGGGPIRTADETPGLGGVKAALAGMLARSQKNGGNNGGGESGNGAPVG